MGYVREDPGPLLLAKRDLGSLFSILFFYLMKGAPSIHFQWDDVGMGVVNDAVQTFLFVLRVQDERNTFLFGASGSSDAVEV